MGFWNKEKKLEVNDNKPLLPDGIMEVEGGYQVIGCYTVHPVIGKALQQLKGRENAR